MSLLQLQARTISKTRKAKNLRHRHQDAWVISYIPTPRFIDVFK